MANFINTNINQTVLIDINYLEQLGKDNFYFYLLLNKTDIKRGGYYFLDVYC